MKILFILALIFLSARASEETQQTTTATPNDPLPFIADSQAINETGDSEMYWIFYPAQNADTESAAASKPTILRLAGEPGVSVMLNNFIEIGPKSLVGDGKTAAEVKEADRTNTWNLDKNLLFIDPLGVGYSHLENSSFIPNNTDQYVQQISIVINKIFGTDGKLKAYANSKIYLSSEDFGSRVAVVLAQQLLNSSKLNLGGLIIGDPLIDPINQITEYGMFGYSLSLLDEDERKEIEILQMNTLYNIKQGNWEDAFGSWINIITTFMGYSNIQDFNDYRSPVKQIDKDNTQIYLDLGKTKVTYNAPDDIKYVLKSDAVEKAVTGDACVSYVNSLANILTKLPVLIHQSQDNLIVNGPGTQNFLSKMKWAGRHAWNDADFTPWIVGGTNYGLVKTHDKLTLALVNKAGMYTGYRQPAAYLDMANKWISGAKTWITDKPTAPHTQSTAAGSEEIAGNIRTEKML